MLEKTDETRRLFARFIGAGEDEIGFLYATSEGENVVVKALDWNAGGQRGRERSRVPVDTGDPDTSRANAGGGAPDGEAPERRPTPAQRSGEKFTRLFRKVITAACSSLASSAKASRAS